MKNKTLLPYLAMLLASVLLVLCLLLPYATSNRERRQWLKKIGDTVINARTGFSGNDYVRLSVWEYAKLSRANVQSGMDRQENMTRLVEIAALAACCLLTALFAALKKPIAAIVFSSLALPGAFVLSEDLAWNRIVPCEAYSRGLSYVLLYIVPLAVIAAALWLIVAQNRSAEKENNKITI